MKLRVFIFIALVNLCFDSFASASRYDELFDPVEASFLKGDKLIERDYGFIIEKPNHEWNWYKSKKTVSERDYLLTHSESDWNYIIQFNKNWNSLTENSVNEYIIGMKEEAALHGFKVDDVSYEITGIYDEHSFIVSCTMVSINDDVQYNLNEAVIVANGFYIAITQYQTEHFGVNELRALLNGIELLEPTRDLATKDESFYSNLGHQFGKLFIWVLVIGISIFLISLFMRLKK